ncbi:hypothetical protein [Chitinophaga solisilvae]|uniref:hypothetical protein n=1 Tax=Chitinophaga solisilvae TaxID=1233460 RepID=UPI0013708D01|nr:hypothetical protein [Chitinophaga solisilvae]
MKPLYDSPGCRDRRYSLLTVFLILASISLSLPATSCKGAGAAGVRTEWLYAGHQYRTGKTAHFRYCHHLFPPQPAGSCTPATPELTATPLPVLHRHTSHRSQLPMKLPAPANTDEDPLLTT